MSLSKTQSVTFHTADPSKIMSKALKTESNLQQATPQIGLSNGLGEYDKHTHAYHYILYCQKNAKL